MQQETPAQGREPRSDDLNRLTWPPLRSDCLAAVCLLLSTYCIVTTTWPAVAVTALVVAVFAGLSPRMTGPFGLKAGETSVGGEFVSPVAEATPAGAVSQPEPSLRELPPRTGSDEG